MRTQHTPHTLAAFPVYSSSFLSSNELILGGGGGASRSGIKNKLRLYDVSANRSLALLDELELEKGEDAPMSIAANPESNSFVCGVNSTVELLQQGRNENCRLVSVKDHKMSFTRTQSTLTSGDLEDYQKISVISPDGTLIAVAGSNTLQLLSYPSLEKVASPVQTDKEIYDATFSDNTLVIATTAALLIYTLSTSDSPSPSSFSPPKLSKKGSKSKSKSTPKALANLVLDRTVEVPASLGGASGATFRVARYHPTNQRILYTAVNTIPSRSSRKGKAGARQGWVCKWNTEKWEVERVRKVGERGVTCFALAPSGNVVGFGGSDLSVGLLDAYTLKPTVTILKAHEFPPTTIAFNPTSSLLASGSPDSVRIVSVPEALGGSSWGVLLVILLTLLIVLLAIAAQNGVVKLT